MVAKLERIAVSLLTLIFVGTFSCAEASAANIDTKAANPSNAAVYSICQYPVAYSCVAKNFDALLELSRSSDSYASIVLYKSLEGCASQFDASRVSKTKTVVLGSDGAIESSTVDAGATSPVVTAFRATSERCANFSKSQIANLNELRWSAAQAGNVRAQYNLVALVGGKSKRGNDGGDAAKLLSILQSNANSGDFKSYPVLSKVYSDGALIPADYVKSYAYMKAYTLKAGSQSDPIFTNRLYAVSSHLSAEERSDAEVLSKQFLNSAN